MIEINIKTFGDDSNKLPKSAFKFEHKDITLGEVAMVVYELESMKRRLMAIEFEPEAVSEEIMRVGETDGI